MTRLVVAVATIGVLALVVTAFAGDGHPRPRHSNEGESVIRPPASIPSSHAYPRAAASGIPFTTAGFAQARNRAPLCRF
jgi:hypothetical protein